MVLEILILPGVTIGVGQQHLDISGVSPTSSTPKEKPNDPSTNVRVKTNTKHFLIVLTPFNAGCP
jgi:hypothetical protein